MKISGKIVDVVNSRIFNGIISIQDDKIVSVKQSTKEFSNYIIPGLIDSHVHIESSMLTPSQFSKLVVPRGTVAVVSDPHEIANVLGIDGVRYMIKDASETPLKCFFGAPSCVPATSFETSGAVISSEDIDILLKSDDIYFLSEMMNYPGVINDDIEVWEKLNTANRQGKRIDGHAPGIKGGELEKYAKGGITSDHECISVDEAIEKIKLGMIIQIREGSAAKNFNALYPLFENYPDHIMLCTDDSHPDEIIQYGHIDKIIKLGLQKGIDILKLLRAATLKPVQHYQLPVGLLQEGDSADFIIVDNLKEFNVLETYINGKKVSDVDTLYFDVPQSKPINNFNITTINSDLIKVDFKVDSSIRVIEAQDRELITDELLWTPLNSNGFIESNVSEDILKIVVVNRYKQSKPIIGFIKGIGLKDGAIACSVAHDSHNLIAVGVKDNDIVSALNDIIKHKGGISYALKDKSDCLPLEVGGLMTSRDGVHVAQTYHIFNQKAKELGSSLTAPFMTLSFMSLLVIPKLKIGDKGLFDVDQFAFTNMYVEK